MSEADDRIRREIEHGKYLLRHGSEKIWNWDSPAGQKRFARRVKMLTSHITPDMEVLEVGCGTGLLTREISKTGANIRAVDISRDLLGEAERLTCSENVRFAMENAYHMSFGAEEFHAIVGSSVLHHLQLESAVREFHRVLKPGGELCFTEPNMMNPQIVLERKIPCIRKRMGVSPDETAFFRWRLAGKLRAGGFQEIFVKPFDFLHPSTPPQAISSVDALGRFLEKVPLLCEIAGSLYVRAKKKTNS